MPLVGGRRTRGRWKLALGSNIVAAFGVTGWPLFLPTLAVACASSSCLSAPSAQSASWQRKTSVCLCHNPLAQHDAPQVIPWLESSHPAGWAGLRLSQGNTLAGMEGACPCWCWILGSPCCSCGGRLWLPWPALPRVRQWPLPWLRALSRAPGSFESPVAQGEKHFRRGENPTTLGARSWDEPGGIAKSSIWFPSNDFVRRQGEACRGEGRMQAGG